MIHTVSNRRRAIGLLTAGLLAFATAVFPSAAPPAQAAVPCPTASMASPAITSWETHYSTGPITLCTGLLGSGNVVVKVQIVDLAAGATLEHKITEPNPWQPNPADNTFQRKTIGEWAAEWGVPGAVNFSVTNGGFFTSTSTPTTKMSLPVRKSSGNVSTGYAIYGTDPAWETPKRVLKFHSLDVAVQQLEIAPFPTYYTAANFQTSCGGWNQCVVGFDPLQDPSGNNSATAPRTYMGTNAGLAVNATRLYILTSVQYLTVAQATAVLKHFGSQTEIQFDGGGSTRMVSQGGNVEPTVGNRAVPHVFIVRKV